MSLSRADVEKVSLLGRLLLSDAELDTMTTQLARVVGYVEQLNEVNTEGIPPMAHAVEMHNIFREDQVRASLPREAALGNAPKRDSECYRVPAVLGE
jgi:aspartyl-tRNA(Asn)/glutamyl-tRNA(Gln) amidotransferase subunit C